MPLILNIMAKIKIVGLKKDREVIYLKARLFEGIHTPLCAFLRYLNFSTDEILKVDTTLECMNGYFYLVSDKYEIHILVPDDSEFMNIIIKNSGKFKLMDVINRYFELPKKVDYGNNK